MANQGDQSLESTHWLGDVMRLADSYYGDAYVSTLAHGACMATPIGTPAYVMYKFIADAYSVWNE